MSSSSLAFTNSPICSYNRAEYLQPGVHVGTSVSRISIQKTEKFKHELHMNGHHQTPFLLFLSEIIHVTGLVTRYLMSSG